MRTNPNTTHSDMQYCEYSTRPQPPPTQGGGNPFIVHPPRVIRIAKLRPSHSHTHMDIHYLQAREIRSMQCLQGAEGQEVGGGGGVATVAKRHSHMTHILTHTRDSLKQIAGCGYTIVHRESAAHIENSCNVSPHRWRVGRGAHRTHRTLLDNAFAFISANHRLYTVLWVCVCMGRLR